MDYDMAYAAFDGALPSDIRNDIFYGADRIHIRILQSATAQQKRVIEIVQALSAWRMAPYPVAMRDRMLQIMSQALLRARHYALGAHSASTSGEENCSAVAVMAPPIKTI